MSLFVPEEEQEPKVKVEPGLTADVDMVIDNGVKKEEENTNNNNDNIKFYDDSASDSEDEDDPIIDTIPVHLNVKMGDENDQVLAPLLLQFPTKSNNSYLSKNNISALHRLQIKPNSGVVELRLPLNTNEFFSGTVSEKYNVSEQFLRGVIIHDEPIGKESEGNVPAKSVMTTIQLDNETQVKQEKKVFKSVPSNNNTSGNNNLLSTIRTQPGAVGGSRYLIGVQDKEGRLHLTPISDTCMLRPHFTYIDNAKMSKLEREREIQRELNDTTSSNSNGTGTNNGNSATTNNGNSNEKKNVSVVTMSAKSTKENIPRLGGALLSAKLETEEEGVPYQIIPCDSEFILNKFTENSGNVLQSKLSQEEYLELLLNQTKL